MPSQSPLSYRSGHVKQALDFGLAFVGQGDGAVLLVYPEVAGVEPLAGFLAFDHFAANQLRDDLDRLVIQVGRFFARTRDNQRRTSFVDQDRVDFVDDGEIMAALLDAIFQPELHVVAKVVEAELVVRAVRDVGHVGLPALFVIEIVNNDAYVRPRNGRAGPSTRRRGGPDSR